MIQKSSHNSYAIATDTSANLPLSRLGGAADPALDPTSDSIYVIPYLYSDGSADSEEQCTDIDAFNGTHFYNRMRHGTRFYTTQVTPQRYYDFFEPLIKAGRDVLFISMSSGISGSFNSASVAANELKEDYPDCRIELIDARGASLGEGIIALLAQRMKKQGKTLDEVLPLLQKKVNTMCQIFTVDSLTYLKRTGRVSNIAATVGNVLNIKPLLKGNQIGQIVACGKVRGRRKSIEQLAAVFEKWTKHTKPELIGIAHADCPEDTSYLIQLLRKITDAEILDVVYEPVTGSHVGPGALALFFDGDPGFRVLE